MANRKVRTKEDKERILAEAAASSVAEAAEKNGVTTSLIYRWRGANGKAASQPKRAKNGAVASGLKLVGLVDVLRGLVKEELPGVVRSELQNRRIELK